MRHLIIGIAISFILLLVTAGAQQQLQVNIDHSNEPPIPDRFPPVNYPSDNGYTPERWALGKKLFFDPVLSLDSSISCASCHLPEFGFSDNRSLSPGIMNRPGIRNAPSLANVAYHPYFLREGSVPTLEMQVLVPIQEENEFAHNIVDIAAQIMHDSAYVAMSIAAYNRLPDAFTITRALATFERTLISGNSRYDQFVTAGITSALNADEQAGMALFFSERLQCGSCHGGFNFTDYRFANNGLDTAYSDIGRMRFSGKESDKGLFKVPSLRNVAVTGPYMHDGRIATLEEVVAHYNTGGAAHPNKSPILQPLSLSAAEQQELVAFLHTLTDSTFISNPVFQNNTTHYGNQGP